MNDELFLRNSTLTDVHQKLRLIDLVAVPWDEEAEVLWRGDVWRETFQRGAFDGIENHAGRVPVNREHIRGHTVGKVVHFDAAGDPGLLARVKIGETARGDETLALATEDMISASAGYYIKSPIDVTLNKRTHTRRVVRAFMDHLSMVESPAFKGAQVLAVREDQLGPAVVETSLPDTPELDKAMEDERYLWAQARLSR